MRYFLNSTLRHDSIRVFAGIGLALAGLGAQSAVATEHECLIEPRMVLKIATPTSGILAEMLVERGDVVTRGQVLARLKSGVEEADVMLNRARAKSEAAVRGRSDRLAFLERKRDRFKLLQATKSVSDAQLDEAQSDVQIARQDLEQATLDQDLARMQLERAIELLQQRTIVSPIDGIVVERSLGPGEHAHEQAPILTVAQIDPLNVELFLPIAAFGSVKVGMEAQVRPAPPISGVHKATVTVVDRVFDSRSGTFGIRLALPNPGNRLPAGMRCRVEIPGTDQVSARTGQ